MVESDSAIGGEVLLILLLIAVNGVLALSEIAVVSARKARLRQRAEDGDAGAATALALAEEPTRFLSTVQVGITLVGIFAGAFGGATIAAQIAQPLRSVPVVGPYADALALFAVVAAITYLSLIFGELVPKRIGLANAEAVAAVVARPMRLLSVIAGPVVSLLSLSTEGVLKVFRLSTKADTTVTEEEVRIMIAEGAEAGVFDEAEREIVESVFRLADRRVGELMIPRPRVVWLDLEDPLADSLRQIATSNHSFYPVARGDLDQLEGVVSTRHLCARLLSGGQADLVAEMIEPTFIPETMTVLQLLDLFRTVSPHVAMVVDEHGTVVGLVTPSDILEAMVGDLADQGADQHPQVVQREDGTWLVDGLLPIEELDELFEVEEQADEDAEGGRVRSVGGLVMHRLGRIPMAGDYVLWHGLRVEVMDMDGRRVDKVLISRTDGVAPSPADEGVDTALGDAAR